MNMSTETVALRLGAPADVAKALEDCCIRYGITSTLQKAHFLGQMAQESQNYSKVVENMNYSAKRMAEVWPPRYATPETAKLPIKQRMPNAKAIALAKQGARAIANDVYGGRMGNRPGTNDGWNYRGQAFKMITGLNNVRQYSFDTYGDDRVVKDPTMLQRLPDSVYSGGWFWKTNNIGPHADRDDAVAVGRLINIGTLSTTALPIGHAQRVANTERAKKLFKDMTQ